MLILTFIIMHAINQQFIYQAALTLFLNCRVLLQLAKRRSSEENTKTEKNGALLIRFAIVIKKFTPCLWQIVRNTFKLIYYAFVSFYASTGCSLSFIVYDCGNEEEWQQLRHQLIAHLNLFAFSHLKLSKVKCANAIGGCSNKVDIKRATRMVWIATEQKYKEKQTEKD